MEEPLQLYLRCLADCSYEYLCYWKCVNFIVLKMCEFIEWICTMSIVCGAWLALCRRDVRDPKKWPGVIENLLPVRMTMAPCQSDATGVSTASVEQLRSASYARIWKGVHYQLLVPRYDGKSLTSVFSHLRKHAIRKFQQFWVWEFWQCCTAAPRLWYSTANNSN